MHTQKTFQLSVLSAAIASTLISGYATAQNSMLEEVIVTATRRPVSLQDIPINITSLSGKIIERDRLTDLVDIARMVPGMTVVDQGPRDSNTLTVRGLNVSSISANDGSNNGGNTVGTYIGEIPLYIDFKLNDMDRVEVLMGPQGTLYGAGTRYRARLIALANCRWYLAFVPVILLGTIFPVSETYCLSVSISL